MKCPDCKKGLLSRNKKPDAIGRTIERCDQCNHRRVVDAPETVPPLSGSVARTNVTVAPVATVGEPCPCCHRKVAKLPICTACKKNRRVLGKSRCEECSQPAALKSRFCVKCGVKFTPVRGEKLSGTAGYRCPADRTTKRRRAAAAGVGA